MSAKKHRAASLKFLGGLCFCWCRQFSWYSQNSYFLNTAQSLLGIINIDFRRQFVMMRRGLLGDFMKKRKNLNSSCARCHQINCINLFKRGDDASIGGELYLYNQLTHSKITEKRIDSHVCSNGNLLRCACFITASLYELYPDDFVVITSNELVRDMKASFYLAMSGHYRQAVLIQRCVLENFLYGLYFYTESHHFARNDEDRKRVKKKFQSWINGGFRKSDEYLREIIEKGGFSSREENGSWGKLFSDLSQFVHTIKKTPTGRSIKYKDFEIKSCYAEVEFDKASLIEWSAYFQEVMFLILHKLLILFAPAKKEEAVALALKILRAEFRNKKEISGSRYLAALLRMRTGRT